MSKEGCLALSLSAGWLHLGLHDVYGTAYRPLYSTSTYSWRHDLEHQKMVCWLLRGVRTRLKHHHAFQALDHRGCSSTVGLWKQRVESLSLLQVNCKPEDPGAEARAGMELRGGWHRSPGLAGEGGTGWGPSSLFPAWGLLGGPGSTPVVSSRGGKALTHPARCVERTAAKKKKKKTQPPRLPASCCQRHPC